MTRNLTGLWVGEYRYPTGSVHPQTFAPLLSVSFKAQITDQGGAFYGEITEDNAPGAHIRGTREGSSVTFSKRYSDTGGGRYLDRIVYEGGLNEDNTRMDGTWMILRGLTRPGAFFMMREKPGAREVDVEREAEIV